MQKPTRFGCLTASERMFLGGNGSGKGAQPVAPWHIPSNWYPVNLPSAPSGAPTYAQCQTLLNNLAPRFAELVILYSTMLPLVYRSVQSGSSGSSVGVNGISGNLGTALPFTPQESVPIDVVNSNPALTYDLASRLAYQTAKMFDNELLAQYAGFSNTVKGTAATALTQAVVSQAMAEIGNTGEPQFLIVSPATAYAMATPTGAYPYTNTFPSVTAGQFSDLSTCWDPAFNTLTPKQTLRILCSDQVTVTSSTYQQNVLITPSALALVTADAPAANTTTTYQVTSVARDPETGNPQLSLELSITNTGNGNQTVQVNVLYVPLVINPANGVNILA